MILRRGRGREDTNFAGEAVWLRCCLGYIYIHSGVPGQNMTLDISDLEAPCDTV